VTLNYVILTLDRYDGLGNFISQGQASFAPSAQLTDAADQQIVDQVPLPVNFTPGASPTVRLLATDNAGPQPAGWVWIITFSGFPNGANPPQTMIPLLFSNGGSQHLSAINPVSSGTTFQAYMPLPTGTSSAGEIIVATGSGSASAWETPASAGLAPLASPAFTGTPTAPTPSPGDNSTEIATTAFMVAALAAYAPLAGAAFTGPVSVSEPAAAGGVLVIANSHITPTSAAAQIQVAQAADAALDIAVTGDANPRFRIDSSGVFKWGTGATGLDTTMSRTGSGKIQMNSLALNNFGSGGAILTVANTDGTPPTAPNAQFIGKNAGDMEIGVDVSGDTQMRLLIDSNGKHTWGPGGSTVGDTNLYRSSAGVLQTDNNLQANSGYLQASRIVAAGITGATAASRYVGATTGGPPNTGTFNVGDFVLDNSTGGWWICTGAGTPGTWHAGGGNDFTTTQQIAAGECIYPRIPVSTGPVLISGSMFLFFWTAQKTETINFLTSISESIAAGATPTYAAFAVFSVDGSGNLTQVAITANDTSIFNGTFQTKKLATTAPWNKIAGQRYAYGILMVSSFAMPNVGGFNGSLPYSSNPPRVAGQITGQTSILSSYAVGSISNASSSIWGVVEPA
jgi:hypothetical protein